MKPERGKGEVGIGKVTNGRKESNMADERREEAEQEKRNVLGK